MSEVESEALRVLRDEVWMRLTADPVHLSPKWFYDTIGSELFEDITQLPEYYLSRAEEALLDVWGRPWIEAQAPACLVELGAGSARKTRVLLERLEAVRPGATYVPLDVAADFLDDTARELRDEFPNLVVRSVVADLGGDLHLPADLPRPAVFALIGSTLGNFARPAAIDLLQRIRSAMAPGDRLLLGVDLQPGPQKSEAELVSAYDDAAGVTARFNLNMLSVLNREAGTNFNRADFAHEARYERAEGRMEMHLVALRETAVVVPGRGELRLDPGASIRTEISCKYEPGSIDDLLALATLRRIEWVEGARGRYAVVVAEPD